MPTNSDVLRLGEIDSTELTALLTRFGLTLIVGVQHEPIPGSYWGDDEAGLQADLLHARVDTPLHSILHEACHYLCLDPARRSRLDTDAASDEAEENAVCYLQILLADELTCLGRERIFADMDSWGYSFRLGSTKAWFEDDAEDALKWLIFHQLVDVQQRPLWKLRQA
ncbi:MAG: hypothetical protein GY896_03745 [Gammaproteobacteria bacterium]|nr:hypothetical protein [Gammaproteobacteria bacterium]